MDLNLLYSRHQISLIRASSAVDAHDKAFHRTLADGFARRIAAARDEIQSRDAGFSCAGVGL